MEALPISSLQTPPATVLIQPIFRQETNVKTMKSINPHVANLPEFMLHSPENIISKTDVQSSTIMQTLFSLGIPSSTIPMCVRNPRFFFIGLGIGAASGSLTALASTSQLDKIESIWHWLERLSAMNSLSKGVFSSLHIAGIAGNTLTSFLAENSDTLAIFEGAMAGTLLSHEGVKWLIAMAHRQMSRTDTALLPSETDSKEGLDDRNESI